MERDAGSIPGSFLAALDLLELCAIAEAKLMRYPKWAKIGKAPYAQIFSALPPGTHVTQRRRHVRFVPYVRLAGAGAISFTAEVRRDSGIVRP